MIDGTPRGKGRGHRPEITTAAPQRPTDSSTVNDTPTTNTQATRAHAARHPPDRRQSSGHLDGMALRHPHPQAWPRPSCRWASQALYAASVFYEDCPR